MKVAIYTVGNNKRAVNIARAMGDGLRRCGVTFVQRSQFKGVEADVAVAYGWTHEPVFTAYREAGSRYACWDLGYWCRRPVLNPQDGYHRLSIDDWDTINIMATGCPDDRMRAAGVEVLEDRYGGDTILIAGMSAKAAGTHGYAEGEWEARTARALRSVVGVGVGVVMRPKPSKRHPPAERIEDALARTRLLVTHHSNAAINALAMGVPVFAVKGVGRLASRPVLDNDAVMNPYRLSLERRRQLLADAAYAQWSVEEMRTGAAWRHIAELLG
jgi:hypothetical protein